MWSFFHVAIWTLPPACSQQSIQTSSFRDALIQDKDAVIWSEQHKTRKCQCWKGLCTELHHFVKKEAGITETQHTEGNITQKEKIYISITSLPFIFRIAHVCYSINFTLIFFLNLMNTLVCYVLFIIFLIIP